MPVLDGSFEAFVTNLGKYNEGELVGEWVHFPTTEEEMKKVFERIGIGSILRCDDAAVDGLFELLLPARAAFGLSVFFVVHALAL